MTANRPEFIAAGAPEGRGRALARHGRFRQFAKDCVRNREVASNASE